MKIIRAFAASFFLITTMANCQSVRYAPGYDFKLFSNTPAYQLAKAVERQDTLAIVQAVSGDKSLIDYREAKFGQTVLTLALVNDMMLSAKKLLALGADPNIRNIYNSSPFLSVCTYASSLENPSQTLLLLIKNGANVNDTQIDTTKDQFDKRKEFVSTALAMLCVHGDLELVKILVENGAKLDTYGKNEHAILSTAVLTGKLDIIRYLMIDVKAPIPDYVIIRQPGTKNEKKMTITDFLNEKDYGNGSAEDEKLKKEILEYLKDQGKR